MAIKNESAKKTGGSTVDKGTITQKPAPIGDMGGGYIADLNAGLQDPNAFGNAPRPQAAPTGPTQDEIDRQNRLKSDTAVLDAYLSSFGLDGILSKATQWLIEGYDAESIKAMIRTTPEYAARFPAMKALAAKGRSLSEAEYIAYERNTAELERLYGLPAGMLTSKDVQTKLITNEVSAKELEQRTIKASAIQYDLPPEFRQMMKNYYNVDSGGLTAYYLDPDVAAPLLEKQFVSSQIGMEAAMKGLSVDSGMSEFLYQQGIDRAQARQGFSQVAGQTGLTQGKGETATQKDLIGSAFNTDAGAAEKARRVASARVGAFAGGGGFVNDRSGVSGLGSAAT